MYLRPRIRFCILVFLCLGTLSLPQRVSAQVTIDTINFPTVQSGIAGLNENTYVQIDPFYTNTSPGTFYLSYGTTIISVGYTDDFANVVSAYDSGNMIDLGTFSGSTREAAEELLRAFLLEYLGTSTEALQLQVANSPTDPVAGNPASLQSRMAAATFASGTDVGPSPLTGGSRRRGTLSYSHLGIGLQSGHYSGPGYSASVQTIPISYALPFEDPRWALKFSMPLAWVRINGETVLAGSVGMGLRMPVFDHWTLTPEIRVGMTQNRTLDINAMLWSIGLTSNYSVPFGNGYEFILGNAIIYSESLETSGTDYDLENTIFKNGFEFSGPMQAKLYGLPTNWQVSLVHNKITGTPTYINEWMDVSVSLGTVASKNGVTWDSVRIGLTYTHANNDVHGINLNFGYEF